MEDFQPWIDIQLYSDRCTNCNDVSFIMISTSPCPNILPLLRITTRESIRIRPSRPSTLSVAGVMQSCVQNYPRGFTYVMHESPCLRVFFETRNSVCLRVDVPRGEKGVLVF